MNKRVHRLVFDRKRGMRVPAAEHVRSAGKASPGQTRTRRAMGTAEPVTAWVGAALVLALGLPAEVDARTLGATVQRSTNLWNSRTNPTRFLPVPSATRKPDNVGSFRFHDGRNGSNLGNDVSSQLFDVDPSSKSLVIKQNDKRIVIHWDSFNIGQGYTVEYVQPEAGTAHNKIGDLKPSLILGNLKANGEVILENSNAGFFFGPTARVDTQRFVVSALSMAQELVRKQTGGDLDSYLMFGSNADTPVYTDADGQTHLKGVVLERGAEIKALAGGEVIMVAPTVYNDGRIETPEGQTILAAGKKVYLMSAAGSNSNDTTQTGLVVAVDAFTDAQLANLPDGTTDAVKQGINVVEHVNAVVAEKGRINLVGMAIRQNGLLSATTAVKGKQGVITLEASKTAGMAIEYTQGVDKSTGSASEVQTTRPAAIQLGSVEFGSNSETRIDPDAGLTTQRDSDVFVRSHIKAAGADILVSSGAQIKAPAGRIDLLAAEASLSSGNYNFILGDAVAPVKDNSRILIEDDADISVAGLRKVKVSGDRHQLVGRFFKSELADKPVQRDGPLYRQEVMWDARKPLTIANALGSYNAVQRTAQEWSTRGGDIRMITAGALQVGNEVKLDISGGSVVYTSGNVLTTRLRRGSQVVDLTEADPQVVYDQLLDASASPSSQTADEQGFDAGSLTVHAEDSLHLGAMKQVKADVVIGKRQRTSITAGFGRSGDVSAAIRRADILKTSPHLYADLRPLGGVLNVGLQWGLDIKSPSMSSIQVQPSALAAEGIGLPKGGWVSSENWSATGLAQLNLNAKTIDIGEGVTLNLGPSGGLNAQSVDQLRLAGHIRAAGGKVELSSIDLDSTIDGDKGQVILTKDAVVDVSGQQVDESNASVASVDVPATLVVDGGEFKAQASKSLHLQAGSQVDVSAGVWKPSNGALVKGKAGSVDLALNRITRGAGLSMQLAGRIQGYGFANGASLSIKGLRHLTVAAEQPSATSDNPLSLSTPTWDAQLSPAFWAAQGFSNQAFSAYGDVTVAANAQIQPTLTNWVMDGATARGALPSTDASPLTRTAVLQNGQRKSVTLKLSATGIGQFEPNPVDGVTQPANVNVQAGALIDAGAGGGLTLEAAGSIDVAGTLRAQGGRIYASLLGTRGHDQNDGSSKDVMGYLADQAITLRGTALVDVAGVDHTYLASNGQRLGQVLGGGEVGLNLVPTQGDDKGKARRGKIITEAGSLVQADGITALEGVGNGTLATVQVSRSAGSIRMASADGIHLRGQLSARRPDAGAEGGLLDVSISREGFNDLTQFDKGQVAYPEATRQLRVVAGPVADEATASVFGTATLSEATLKSAGFSTIQLRSEGQIALGDGVNLQAGMGQPVWRSLSLNARVLSLEGVGTHQVQAHHVAMGDVDHKRLFGVVTQPQPAPSAGPGSLTVEAGRIEVHGSSAIQGSGNTTLAATLAANGQSDARTDGEVVFIGRSYPSDEKTLQNRLAFDGDMTVRAGQLYASTLTQAELQGTPGTSRLTIEQPRGGSTSKAPLSALAKLTLSAHEVAVAGVVRQPFGSIAILGEKTPILGSGSLLSVSGDGLKVPVGSTFSQTSWYYNSEGIKPNEALNTALPTVQTLSSAALNKGILVKGEGLVIDHQSTMQAQAGGDLLTWEFLKGVGGSTDTLARPGVYVVLPSYTHDFAPHDTEILRSQALAGTSLAAGEQLVVTTPNGVLAPGKYTLLPARYGILPGAIMVEKVAVGNKSVLSSALALADGSVPVSGYQQGLADTAAGNATTPTRWQLTPEASLRAKSNLGITSVSDLLSRNALKLGNPRPTLPGDAGRVSLVATNSNFDWAANYQLEGGQLDLSMKHLLVLGNGQSKPDNVAEDVGVVTAEQLVATGAASVLLGGSRDGVSESASLQTAAETVTIAGSLSAAPSPNGKAVNEWLLTAKQKLDITAGSQLSGGTVDDGQSNQIQIKGAGAALVVSNRGGTTLSRDLTGVGAQARQLAQLELAANAKITGQAVELDSSGQINRDSTAKVAAQSLGMGAQQVSLGASNAAPETLALQADDFNRERVSLRSYSRFDIHGSQTLGEMKGQQPLLKQLTLDTPVLAGLGQAGDVVKINAQQVVLRNTSGVAADASATGQSVLDIQARPAVKDATAAGIVLGAGQQRLAFATVGMTTSGDVVIDGKGSTLAQGQTDLNAARVTGTSGAGHLIQLDQGTLTVSRFANTHPQERERSLHDVVGLGAKFEVEADRIVQAGTIDMPSGQVILRGRGTSASAQDTAQDANAALATVVFKEGSRTLARGQDVMHQGKRVAVSPGGLIEARADKGWIDLRGELDVSVPNSSTVSQVGVAAGDIRFVATDTAGGGLVVRETAKLLGAVGTATGDAPVVGTAADAGSLKLDLGQLLAQHSDGSGGQVVSQGDLNGVVVAAMAGGFHREMDVRVRQGDLALSTTLSVGRLTVSADAGSITLKDGAQVKTSAAAVRGGVVQLAARDDVVLQSGAVVDASANNSAPGAAGNNGGDVLLASSQGQVRLESGSQVVAGEASEGQVATQGRVVVRTSASTDSTSGITQVNAQLAVGSQVQAGQVLLEAVTLDDQGSSNVLLDTSKRAAYLAQADALQAQASDIALATGLSRIANGVLRHGVELRTQGNITLNSDWNLYRNEGTQPINVTLRAGQALTLNGSLSDGFVSATRADASSTTPSAMGEGEGGSFRLVAGADTSAAHVMTTSQDPTRHLTVAGNKMVRTTSGSIEMAASGDVVLRPALGALSGNADNSPAVVYVAGKAALPLEGDTSTVRSDWQRFTEKGGRLEVQAGGHITAPAMVQGFGNSFLHTGKEASTVAWATDFDAFRLGLGSMGGGDIRVTAGGNISNLGVVAPTSARTYLNAQGLPEQWVQNGGNVLVHAGGNVNGGQFLLGRGKGWVSADQEVSTGSLIGSALPTALVLGLMDGQWRVQGREGARVASVYNPTSLDGRSGSRVGSSIDGSYLTYSQDAAISVSSLYGDVVLDARSLQTTAAATGSVNRLLTLQTRAGIARENLNFSASNPATRAAFFTLPGYVEATALQGGLKVDLLDSSMVMAPAVTGDLRLFANGDLSIGAKSASARGLLMSDADPGVVTGTVSSPVSGSVNAGTWVSNDLHKDDTQTASVIAGRDIQFLDSTRLTLPKSLYLSAGRDLLQPSVAIKHSNSTDASTLEAGRNVLGFANSDGPTRTDGLIQLNGPGELLVQAGRTLDLSTSAGIEATGAGALLRVAAATQRQVDVDQVVATYLSGDSEESMAARQALKTYVQNTLQVQGLSDTEAIAHFRDMTSAHQVSFVEQQLLLPRFVQRFLVADSQNADLPWAWAARSAGVDASDTSSALYQSYLATKSSLVNYVQDTTQRTGLTFETALDVYRKDLTSAQRSTFIDKRQIDPDIAMGLLAAMPMDKYLKYWQNLVAAQPEGKRVALDDYNSDLFRRFSQQVVLEEVRRTGSVATAVADSANVLYNPRREQVRNALWQNVASMSTLAGLNEGFDVAGDIDLSRSKVHALGGGSLAQNTSNAAVTDAFQPDLGGINLITAGGGVTVGAEATSANDLAQAATRGLAAYNGGTIQSFTKDDFQVGEQKVHIVGSGNMTLYSAAGNIDSGRGSNTAVTVPPQEPVDDGYGVYRWRPANTTTGSGLAIFENQAGTREGTIGLFAPKGEVRALDAFIDAPNIDLGANRVVGGDNLKGGVSGSSAPPAVTVNLAVNSGLGTESAVTSAQSSMAQQSSTTKERSSFLTVDVLGLGDDDQARTATEAETAVATPAPSSGGSSAKPVKPCRKGDLNCRQ